MPNRCGGWILPKLDLSIHVVQVYMCIQRSPAKIQTPTHKNVKPYRPQLDRPATYVVAQQYSYATSSHSRKGKFGARFQNIVPINFFTSIFVCLKLLTWNCVNRGMYVVHQRECLGGGGSLCQTHIFASRRVELGTPSFVTSNFSDIGIN